MVEVVASQIKKTHDKGCKIALVRDLAIQLGCDPEVIAFLQEHYDIEKQQLIHTEEGNGAGLVWKEFN